MAEDPTHRLIVYGSLAPGGPNAFLLENLEGTWERCVIRGRMGRWRGFKSFRWDPEGQEISAWLFTSQALPQIFPELDDFEGEEYQRRVIPVQLGGLTVLASIYEGKYAD